MITTQPEEEAALKIVTLCHIVDVAHQRILLGRKKRGFGEGKYNGFGGKIEEGESARDAVVREIREEAGLLARHWSTPRGGMIVFDYGDWEAIDVKPETPVIMFDEFRKLSGHDAGDRIGL